MCEQHALKNKNNYIVLQEKKCKSKPENLESENRYPRTYKKPSKVQLQSFIWNQYFSAAPADPQIKTNRSALMAFL